MEEQQKRRKIRETKKFSVGLMIIFALFVLLLAIYMVGSDQGLLQKKYELRTRMQQTGGLEAGAPVHLSGVRIGNVTELFFYTANSGSLLVEVVFEVSPEVKQLIHTDSRVYIGTLGLLGDKYLGVTPGGTETYPASPGAYLQSDDPVDFERVLQKSINVVDDFKKSAKSLQSISAKIDTGKGTLGQLVNSDALWFDLVRLLNLMEKISGKIDNGDGTIGKLFNDQELYNSLDATLKNITSVIDTFEQNEGTLKLLMTDREMYDQLNSTIEKADSLLYQIEQGEGTAGQLISNKELYDKLNSTVDNLDSLVTDVQENPRKYINLKFSIF